MSDAGSAGGRVVSDTDSAQRCCMQTKTLLQQTVVSDTILRQWTVVSDTDQQQHRMSVAGFAAAGVRPKQAPGGIQSVTYRKVHRFCPERANSGTACGSCPPKPVHSSVSFGTGREENGSRLPSSGRDRVFCARAIGSPFPGGSVGGAENSLPITCGEKKLHGSSSGGGAEKPRTLPRYGNTRRHAHSAGCRRLSRAPYFPSPARGCLRDANCTRI